MKQEYLSVAKGIKFPSDAVTQKMADLGRTGSGKTYLAMKIAEEMLKINAQIVVLDPVGKWYGLQTLKNGKKGFSIPVFGGLHGDIPLQSTSGTLVADLIVDKNISAVIDVSQFETDAEKTRFATDFSARLYFRKKASPSPIHLFIEECQEFIPQIAQKGEERMLHNFQRIWKLGRNFGIGGSLISQRPQEINKKALNQTECVFTFQMTGPHEKKAIEDWVGAKGFEEKENVKDLLPKLKNGECWVWSPVWLNTVKLIKAEEKETIDISATPKLGQKAIKPAKLSSSEIEEIKNAMAETIQHIQENDPDELKKKIKALEKEIRQKTLPPASGVTKDKATAFIAMERELNYKLSQLEKKNKEHKTELATIYNALKTIEVMNDKAKEKTNLLYDFIKGKMKEPSIVSSLTKETKVTESTSISHIPKKEFHHAVMGRNHMGRTKEVLDEISSLGKGEKVTLIACAQFPNGLFRNQISVIIQYAPSSRDAYIHRLKEKGLVTTDNKVRITQKGIELLGTDYKPLPTGDELREHWLNTLPQGEKVMLELICNVFPDSITRNTLTEKSGYANSSRDAYLHRMLNKEIIEIVNRGEVKASESLFS